MKITDLTISLGVFEIKNVKELTPTEAIDLIEKTKLMAENLAELQRRRAGGAS